MAAIGCTKLHAAVTVRAVGQPLSGQLGKAQSLCAGETRLAVATKCGAAAMGLLATQITLNVVRLPTAKAAVAHSVCAVDAVGRHTVVVREMGLVHGPLTEATCRHLEVGVALVTVSAGRSGVRGRALFHGGPVRFSPPFD